MAQQYYLDESTIEKIYAEISEIYGNQGALRFNLSIYKAQVDSLIKEMNLMGIRKYNSFTGKYFTSYEINKEVQNKSALAAKGYLLIFKLREYLTKESINYRYYFTDTSGDVKVREFGEDKLLEIMQFSDNSNRIGVGVSKLMTIENQLNAEQQKQKNIFENLMNKQFKKYTYPKVNDYMRALGSNNLRQVRSAIMAQYGKNPGLRTKDGRYQTFNEGHIYESLDVTLTYLFLRKEALESISFKDVDDFMFGSFLSRDNVKASKGADNQYSKTSIKSNNASFYNFNTISNQLVQIQKMLNSTDEKEIRDTITNMFLDNTKTYQEVQNDLSQVSDKALQELLEWTKTNLTK